MTGRPSGGGERKGENVVEGGEGGMGSGHPGPTPPGPKCVRGRSKRGSKMMLYKVVHTPFEVPGQVDPARFAPVVTRLSPHIPPRP